MEWRVGLSTVIIIEYAYILVCRYRMNPSLGIVAQNHLIDIDESPIIRKTITLLMALQLC